MPGFGNIVRAISLATIDVGDLGGVRGLGALIAAMVIGGNTLVCAACAQWIYLIQFSWGLLEPASS